MDEPLHAISDRHGVFLYGEALGLGHSKAGIAARRRSGEWHRVRHGAYCFGETWVGLNAEERHILLAQAVRRTTPGEIAFSHTTALLLHGVDVWGADLQRVHATRLDTGAHRTERDVVHHVGDWVADDLADAQGLTVTTPGRAVVEHATISNLESALVSTDNALNQGLTLPAELRAYQERFGHWPGSRKLHVALHHMDGRSASVGETRSRHLFWLQGLPRPQLQYPVYDGSTLVAITDFAWPAQRLLGEFDGRQKYVRHLRPGETPGDAVFREKVREDMIRRLTGWSVVRLVWADLYSPARTAAHVRSLLQGEAS